MTKLDEAVIPANQTKARTVGGRAVNIVQEKSPSVDQSMTGRGRKRDRQEANVQTLSDQLAYEILRQAVDDEISKPT